MQMQDENERQQALDDIERRNYTGTRIVEELRRWHVMKARFLEKEFLSVPPASAMAVDVLQRLGVKLPPKMIELKC